VLGQHNGYMFYTIGQNKNLGLGGQKSKYYVCKKDVKQNIIYVVDQKHHDQFLKSNQCRLIQFN
jgi:tRNA-specific 2-thiouridylase